MTTPWIRRNPVVARTVLYGTPIVLLLAGATWIWTLLPKPDDPPPWLGVDWQAMEVVELLQEYVQIDTSFPDGNEIPGAEFLARHLQEAGAEVHLERLGDRNANLWADLPGRDSRALVMHHHIDVDPVVESGQAWTHPPFSGAIDPPFLYGRGSFDMKSLAAVQLKIFLDLARAGTPLDRRLRLLATGDEERDSWLGTRRLLRDHPEWSEEYWAVFTEGGTVESVNEREIKYWGTEFQQRRFYDVWVCSSDLERLERLRRDLEKRSTERVVTPDAVTFLRQYADSRDGPVARELFSRPETILEAIRTFPDPVTYDLIPRLTDSVLRSETTGIFPVEEVAGDGYRFRIILALLPGLELDDVWADLIGSDLDGFTYRVEVPHDAVDSSPLDHPAFRQIDEVLEEWYPGLDHGPYLVVNAATDARFFRQAGIPTYGFWPFAFVSADALRIGGTNERIALPAFVEGHAIYRELVHRLVGAPSVELEPLPMLPSPDEADETTQKTAAVR